MLPKFNRGDVVRQVHHQSGIFIVGSGQVESVGDTKGFLFNYVVNAFSRQTLSHMACNLVNEAIRDDGDVFDAGTANGAQGVIDHRSVVQRKERFLRVLGERVEP